MDSNQPAKLRFDALDDYQALQNLIDEGECEDLIYECKSPTQPTVGHDIKVKLAKAISGFSNAEGGILIYGMETQKHQVSASDVMVQITSIGSVNMFTKRILNLVPTLTMPAVTNFEHRILKEKPSDTKGVLILFIQPSSRPVQSLDDKKFWFRGGDQFVEAPYTMIERLFAATDSPDILVKLEQLDPIDEARKEHTLSIILQNNSSAVGRDINLVVTVLNPQDTSSVMSSAMSDASSINKGRTVFTHKLDSVLHNGLNAVAASLDVIMVPKKRKLLMTIAVFSDKMASRKFEFNCYLGVKTFKISDQKQVS